MQSRLHSEPSAELNSRLVTLFDGRAGLRSGLQVEVTEPPRVHSLRPSATERQPGEPEASGIEHNEPLSADQSSVTEQQLPTLDFVASDETLDRCDEMIVASGWRLDSYRRNPVFQNAHQYGDIIFTLGKALVTEVKNVAGRQALFQRVQFATEANPMARIAHALYKGKFLNAVSVGFIPLRWENGDGVVQSAGTQFRRRYLEHELIEVSAVGIPANPNALQLGLKAGAIQKSDVQELLEVLRSLGGSGPEREVSAARLADDQLPITGHPSLFQSRSTPAVPDTHTCALGVRSYEAQLLQLAREVREALKRAT